MNSWTPKEILQQERDQRVKQLQDALLHVIKLQAIPPEECCSALAGCITYIIGLNTPQYKYARETVGIIRKQMLTALTKDWPRFMSLRQAIAEKLNGQHLPEGRSEGDSRPGREGEGSASSSIPEQNNNDHANN